jgi:hypothetical protein
VEVCGGSAVTRVMLMMFRQRTGEVITEITIAVPGSVSVSFVWGKRTRKGPGTSQIRYSDPCDTVQTPIIIFGLWPPDVSVSAVKPHSIPVPVPRTSHADTRGTLEQSESDPAVFCGRNACGAGTYEERQ